jgi:hypothetical protein
VNDVDDRVIQRLLGSDEPSVVWRIRSRVLGQSETDLSQLQNEIRRSVRAQTLFDRMTTDNVYGKWHGAHWVLAALADLGFPSGSPELIPIRDRVFDHWLSKTYFTEFEAMSSKSSYATRGVPVMQGRYRRCASQQGNALRSLLQLGLADDRADMLVERLLHWQWPDGGWNCDRNPTASTSSFMETLLPMRGLAAYGESRKDADAKLAARRAADVFLERGLVFGRRTQRPIHPEFLRLHYPHYWYYDLLAGLVAMAEMNLLGDHRCEAALDLLEEKRLADGGWPAEGKFYSVSEEPKSRTDSVDWSGTSRTRMNPWVTAEALMVLKQAGRI